MTEPVLSKSRMLIVLLTGLQALLPAGIALVCLRAVLTLSGDVYDASSTTVGVVGVLCLILVHPPREVSSQLSSPRTDVAVAVAMRWLLLMAVLLAIGYVSNTLGHFPPSLFLTWALVTPVFVIIATLIVRGIMRRVLLSSSDIRKVVFAGYNESSLALARRLRDNPSMCMSVRGFFDDRSMSRLALADDFQLIGKLSEVAGFMKKEGIDVIYIALPIRHLKRVMDLLDDLRDTTASIYYVPDIFVFDLIQARSGEIEGVPVFAMCETPFYGYRGVSKRITDIVVSTTALLMLLPLLLGVSMAIKATSKGPVIFRQRRYGLDGREITVYKFRSMKVSEDGAEVKQASKSDSRLTSIGGLLRRTSLDELPQLINVLQGRMSLVGPRPHAVAHNEQYRKLIKGYMIRHKVLPGITGLAQVSGCRGETARLEEMEARVRYDLDYLRHWSLLLDLKILFRTAIKIFKDDKAY